MKNSPHIIYIICLSILGILNAASLFSSEKKVTFDDITAPKQHTAYLSEQGFTLLKITPQNETIWSKKHLTINTAIQSSIEALKNLPSPIKTLTINTKDNTALITLSNYD